TLLRASSLLTAAFYANSLYHRCAKILRVGLLCQERDGFVKIAGRKMRIPQRHRHRPVPEEFTNRVQWNSSLSQSTSEGMPQAMEVHSPDLGFKLGIERTAGIGRRSWRAGPLRVSEGHSRPP